MKIKGFIIVGILAVIAGCATMTYGLAKNDFKFEEVLNIENYEAKSVEFEETDSLTIDINYASIVLQSSDTATNIRIDYMESEYRKYEITNVEGVLVIKQINDNKKPWFQHFFSGFYPKPITISVPSKLYTEVSIKSKTSSMRISKIKATKLTTDSTTGDLNMNDCVIDSMTVLKATTGEITLNNVTSPIIQAQVTTGEISIYNSDIKSADLKATTGEIEVYESTFEKVKATATTGTIKMRDSVVLDIYTKVTTGEIRLRLRGAVEDYKINTSVSVGNSNIENKTDGKYSLEAHVTTGDIRVFFEQK